MSDDPIRVTTTRPPDNMPGDGGIELPFQETCLRRVKPACHCSALHTSPDCPQHGKQFRRSIARDLLWRFLEAMDDLRVRLLPNRKLPDGPIYPVITIDEAKGIAFDPAIGKDQGVVTFVRPDGQREMTLPEGTEIEIDGVTIQAGAPINLVQPPGADAPQISMVRPFGQSRAQKAIIEAFKKNNPEVAVDKPPEPMSGHRINLKPIIDV